MLRGFSVRVARVKNVILILLLFFCFGAKSPTKDLETKEVVTTLHIVYQNNTLIYLYREIDKTKKRIIDYGVRDTLVIYRDTNGMLLRVKIENKLLDENDDFYNFDEEYSYSYMPNRSYDDIFLLNKNIKPNTYILTPEVHGIEFIESEISKFFKRNNVTFVTNKDLERFKVIGYKPEDTNGYTDVDYRYGDIIRIGQEFVKKAYATTIDILDY